MRAQREKKRLFAQKNESVGKKMASLGRGVCGFQVTGLIKGFLGLMFLIPGFFRVAKFGKYSFVGLDLSRDFFWYSKQSENSW